MPLRTSTVGAVIVSVSCVTTRVGSNAAAMSGRKAEENILRGYGWASEWKAAQKVDIGYKGDMMLDVSATRYATRCVYI